jgi:hypothetical protein
MISNVQSSVWVHRPHQRRCLCAGLDVPEMSSHSVPELRAVVAAAVAAINHTPLEA